MKGKKTEFRFIGVVDEVASGKLYFRNTTKSPLDFFDTNSVSPGDELYRRVRFGDSVYETNPNCGECSGPLFRGDYVMVCPACGKTYPLKLLPEDKPGRRQKNLSEDEP